MLNPKKTIPNLAAGVLALAGCATGDGAPNGTAGTGGMAGTGGTGGSDGAALANALSAWCMKHADCFPNRPYYQPTDDCISYELSYYGLDGDISAACETAAIGYFDCALGLACPQLDLDKNACDDEWDDDAEANCPDWPIF